MIAFDKKKIEEEGLTIPEALLLCFYNFKYNEGQVKYNMQKKGLIAPSSVREINQTGVMNTLTVEGERVLQNITSTMIETGKISKERTLSLAQELKAIFPKGKKPGTQSYWAEGTMLIARRLEQFFKKYGTAYTDEQILDATRRYVQSFNGNYTYMRVLKYFLYRSKMANGEDVESSDLLTFMENEKETTDSDWTSELI